MIKPVPTRWLTLELAIEWSLKQYPGLKSYFLSEDESQLRFCQLQTVFGDPITEVYLFSLQSLLSVFNHANKFLQREEPLIHILQQQLYSLLKKVLGKFVKPSVLVESIQKDSLLALNFHDPSIQVSDCDLVIGIVTKQTLQKIFDEGNISENKRNRFYLAVRVFLVCATKFLLKWCPFKDELLSHVFWVCFKSRLEKTFSSFEYIVHRYSILFLGLDMDKLNEQFLTY